MGGIIAAAIERKWPVVSKEVVANCPVDRSRDVAGRSAATSSKVLSPMQDQKESRASVAHEEAFKPKRGAVNAMSVVVPSNRIARRHQEHVAATFRPCRPSSASVVPDLKGARRTVARSQDRICERASFCCHPRERRALLQLRRGQGTMRAKGGKYFFRKIG